MRAANRKACMLIWWDDSHHADGITRNLAANMLRLSRGAQTLKVSRMGKVNRIQNPRTSVGCAIFPM